MVCDDVVNDEDTVIASQGDLKMSTVKLLGPLTPIISCSTLRETLVVPVVSL